MREGHLKPLSETTIKYILYERGPLEAIVVTHPKNIHKPPIIIPADDDPVISVKEATIGLEEVGVKSKSGDGVPGVNVRVAAAFAEWQVLLRCFVPWARRVRRERRVRQFARRFLRPLLMKVWNDFRDEVRRRRMLREEAVKSWTAVSYRRGRGPFDAWRRLAQVSAQQRRAGEAVAEAVLRLRVRRIGRHALRAWNALVTKGAVFALAEARPDQVAQMAADAQNHVADLNQALDKARIEATQMAAEVERNQAQLRHLQLALDKANRSTSESMQALKHFRAENKRLRSVLEAVGSIHKGTVKRIAQEYDTLTKPTTTTDNNLPSSTSSSPPPPSPPKSSSEFTKVRQLLYTQTTSSTPSLPTLPSKHLARRHSFAVTRTTTQKPSTSPELPFGPKFGLGFLVDLPPPIQEQQSQNEQEEEDLHLPHHPRTRGALQMRDLLAAVDKSLIETRTHEFKVSKTQRWSAKRKKK